MLGPGQSMRTRFQGHLSVHSVGGRGLIGHYGCGPRDSLLNKSGSASVAPSVPHPPATQQAHSELVPMQDRLAELCQFYW